MAVPRQQMLTTAKQAEQKRNAARQKVHEKGAASEHDSVVEDHLPPLPLVLIILFCSGALLVFALRDFLATGRNIGGAWDEAMLLFTKSTDWFDNAKGWRSTQGGFSAVARFTTDKNNMGGFFVRKVAGAASVGVHLQKIIPMLSHPTGAQWIMGHFRPMLMVALLGNLAIASLYIIYWGDLEAAGVVDLPRAFLSLLALESLAILFYLLPTKAIKRGCAIAMPEGKTPKSLTSNIVSRTVLLVSAGMAVIAGRDLFFPGYILPLVPRDDIYLEWTNALLHSPPDGSPEALEHGLESPLYIGDKFMSQFMGIHVLILCLYKFVTAVGIRYGNDGSGEVKCQMIWKTQAIANAMILFTCRVFQPAAVSASLDLRWHLMFLGYETIVLFLYAFF